MMHMRPAQMQKQIGHFAAHYQNHESPRGDEGQQKRHEGQPCQMPQRLCRNIHVDLGLFRNRLFAIAIDRLLLLNF